VWYEKKSTGFILQTVLIIWFLSADITLETIHYAYVEIPFRVLFGMPEIQLSSMLSIYWTWNFFSLERNFKLSEDSCHRGLLNLHCMCPEIKESDDSFCSSLEASAALLPL
jgi:hypothetical protein